MTKLNNVEIKDVAYKTDELYISVQYIPECTNYGQMIVFREKDGVRQVVKMFDRNEFFEVYEKLISR